MNPSDAVSHDFSLIGLFLQADLVVKAVLVVLMFMSFWCWTIIFDKLIKLRRLRDQAAQFEETFWSGGSLEELFDRIGNRPVDPMSAVFSAAMREWRRTTARVGNPASIRVTLHSRIERVMEVTGGREMERLEKYMP
ncbi:MAG: Tol-Pal system subunit TolQ, partial [Alphaproteobacteria bacterium]|nr:Tol-Pal system subunit TolQ [Alphaproteobacteria bacterium]